MHMTLILVLTVIVLALVFDFINGFHDSANSIATIVVSKTLTPLQAVVLAGIANFFGYFTFGTAVAKMIGKGVVIPEAITLPIVLAAILGAIIWNLITWYFGIPTSSSHALIGGLVGSAMAALGTKVILLHGLIKIFIFIFVAPILGMIGAMFFTTLVLWLFRNTHPTKTGKLFKNLQLISATFYSLGHGTNDAQKSMGIIALALFTAGFNPEFKIYSWIAFSCYTAMALGTMFGGWRIVKTMGTSITKIRQMEGFCAETASALVLIGTAHAGIPVSTTHVIAGSIMGVGTVEHARSVRWTTARAIVWAWIITIPTAAFFSGTVYLSAAVAGHLLLK